MGLFGDSSGIAIPDKQNMAKLQASLENKGEEHSFIEERRKQRGIVWKTKCHWRKVSVGKWWQLLIGCRRGQLVVTRRRGSLSPAGLRRADQSAGLRTLLHGHSTPG